MSAFALSAGLPHARKASEFKRIVKSKPNTFLPAVEAVMGFATPGVPIPRELSRLAGSSAVFRVSEQHVVKIYPPAWSHDYEAEVEAYRIISHSDGCALTLPRVLSHGSFTDNGAQWFFVVMTAVPGALVKHTLENLSTSERSSLAVALSSALLWLHARPVGDDVTLPRIGRQELAETWAKNKARLSHVLNATVIEGLTLLAEHTLANLPPSQFLHGDVGPGNVTMIKEGDTWRAVGLLDFGDSVIAPPPYELVWIWFDFCRCDVPFMRAFLRSFDPGLRVDTDWRRRMLGYTVIHKYGAKMFAYVQEAVPDCEESLTSIEGILALLWPQDLEA